ncbi:hypothetical protein PROFUN_06271 [Planoprotostelium fungivorum]|uniref:Uncharacterized protein n=1 Tax=Planoprotostelium fungivorum TaxID=1890364 RepID=A0A2P6NE78_9EUKA|nr:hypothetical protein PROFUN_06271 [Planoprotostelium fungivorum]
MLGSLTKSNNINNSNDMATLKDQWAVGPHFWNIRTDYKVMLVLNVGTQMSLIRLESGRFLIIDAAPLTNDLLAEINTLTSNGTLIDAILHTHPFHSDYIEELSKHYPNAALYGAPRHLKKFPSLQWTGRIDDPTVLNKWAPEVEMRIPAGSEFVEPAESNHFNSVWVFHRQSRTLHVDDTIMYLSDPPILAKLLVKAGMSFHPTLKHGGLHETKEAPLQFRDFVKGVIADWDFDNLCAAHSQSKIGGAKNELIELLAESESVFLELSEKYAKKETSHHPWQVEVDELPRASETATSVEIEMVVTGDGGNLSKTKPLPGVVLSQNPDDPTFTTDHLMQSLHPNETYRPALYITQTCNA